MTEPVRQTATAEITPDQRHALGRELDRLLGLQLARVRRRFFVHGLAKALLLPAAVVLAAFLLDHVLRLPTPIRVFHTLLMLAALTYAAVRFIAYPLSRRFQPVDVALLLERAFPELHQRLVSAIQLKGALQASDAATLRNQSPLMIEQLLAETTEQTRSLPLERLLIGRQTARLWAAAATLLAALLLGIASAPATALAFVLRHLGADASYPRATMLQIELPPASADLQRTDSAGRSDLIVPAGADLHVSVLANGVVPDETFLDVEDLNGDRRSVVMAVRPAGRFRHVFRRLTGNFSFHARGGDDDRGDRVVSVRTIHPPAVAEIKAELRPPAYTGRPLLSQSGGAIEGLIGTDVRLSVIATAPVHTAIAVFLESGQRLELQRTAVGDDAGPIPVYVGNFAVTATDRYQIELLGDSGLRNPNPGTYPITALQDYAPVGRWLVPDDEAGTLLLADALLCVRAEARDDFGLQFAELTLDTGLDQQKKVSLLATAANTAPPDTNPAVSAAARPQPTTIAVVELIGIGTLLGENQHSSGVSLQIDLADNKQPTANTTQLPRRQVQIVDQAQLAAAIGRHFRGLREEVEQALDLQNDRRLRTQELAVAGAPPNAAMAQALTAIEVGQGRVLSATDRLLRGTMRAFDLHLWNHQDPSPNSKAVVDLYALWYRSHPEAVAYQPGFYFDLAQRRQQGTLGAMETCLDPILQMVQLSGRLQTELVPAAVRLLAQAQVARNAQESAATLLQIVEAQTRIVACLQDLLGRLDEWNDYQDLVQEARALREKQRDVQTRTESVRGKK